MSDLKYTEAHEWLRREDDGSVTIGITDYAQEQLGDVVYVELPESGRALQRDEEIAIIESVKAAGEIRAPFAGTVAAINERLADEPEIVNVDPLGDGWLLRMSMDQPADLDAYLDAEAYREYLAGL